MEVCMMDSSGSGYGLVAVSNEDSNEPLDCIEILGVY
jgi:hypothetical protein